jgi:hypothetical protein
MWRKKSNVSATELHGIVAELNVRVMHLRKLMDATDLEPVNKLLRFDAEEYGNDAEKIAGLVLAGRKIDLRLLAALKPEWKASMASLVFAAKRAGYPLNETQAQYIWKQFNIHKIKLREPPELDFPAEEPRTLSDLVSLHINDMGYSLGDLSKVLIMNETELAKTYSIDLPGHEKGRAAHLRVIQ